MRKKGQTATFGITRGAVEPLHRFTLLISGTWSSLMDPASTNMLFTTNSIFLSLHNFSNLHWMTVQWWPFEACILEMWKSWRRHSASDCTLLKRVELTLVSLSSPQDVGHRKGIGRLHSTRALSRACECVAEWTTCLSHSEKVRIHQQSDRGESTEKRTVYRVMLWFPRLPFIILFTQLVVWRLPSEYE